MKNLQQSVVKESFATTCEDGVELRGVLLIPDSPKAVVQFNCGTGAKKEAYLSFLTHLAEHGYLCCLWDYRGSGESTAHDLANCDFQFSDYGIKDMPAIKGFLSARFPELPYFLIGHSAGGQQIGWMDDLSGIRGAVQIAVSAGYYPFMPIRYRLKAYFFFYLFTPLSILLCGYVRAKKFGLMEDLPKGVVLQWRDWLESKDYFFDSKFFGKSVPEGHFRDFDFPIHVFWTVDDTISNERNVSNYWKHVQSSRDIAFTRLVPQEMGLSKIGHFGFFKKPLKNRLWPSMVERLDEWLECEQSRAEL